MKVLAFESSCDESAIALFDSSCGFLYEGVNTQVALHAQYGGVVPDLASREHLANFPVLLSEALRAFPQEIVPAEIDTIAVTRGPGLAGCLALGIALAKAIAELWQKPIVGVNHLRGHLFSPFIPLFENGNFEQALATSFPCLGLVVSGGNTLLAEIDAERRVRILAGTVDDAAGEAFDKGAKLLGMPYPGGALIEKQARLARRHGQFDFPHGDAIRRESRFSFSGLKTSLRYKLEHMDDAALAASFPELCADYQDAIVAQLVGKIAVQFERKPYRSIAVGGGVSNNGVLRSALEKLAKKQKVPLYLAHPKHTGDNAAMIAFAAWFDKQLPFPQKNMPVSFVPSLTLENP
ncbi:MAG: tRNA (adenosine(37)-N6)-threonylcarbamoyltransferase complex transferase subunit TsaD [Opitutales bacterium]|nr:tRNA (adenosine(37)-N6)-threonylcarbamoyltransferase complex transferase subunit TsaD [Opitutales bacterium]